MPKGSCWCKTVTYEFSAEPAMKVVCHCLSCQKISGSAFTANIFVPKSSLQITSGSAKLKKYVQPHETGLAITLTFCSNCSTALYKHGGSEKYEDYYVVQAGTIDAEEGEGGKTMGIDVIVPDEEYWTKFRACWLGPVKGLKQFEEFA
ncbi:hypothetical protein IFR05_005567 [Cadophora sp. M221]|nr:hypothetical protein IFR05_005567 [Cadophora sp. M221]